MISPATIERVKELSIEDVVRKYVPDLKKSGTNWSAKSPFTDEKTASFYVVPARNFFKCFSTGKGGSGITFVMELKGGTYVDAIKTICSDFQIQIEYESNGLTKEHYDKVEELHKLNRAASRQYVNTLKELPADHPAWLEIKKRQWDEDTIAQWQLGFAPGDVGTDYTPQKWNFLAQKINNSGNHSLGLDLGLIKVKEDKGITYDTFRNRIIFPIHDHQNKLVGFGGRALKVDEYNQKYINSSNSAVFDKSKVLYGLYYAEKAIKKTGFAILLEGYADVISFHQGGLNNSVCNLGTSLTDEQCKLLSKSTNKVVVVRDGDNAGTNATLRDVDILLKHSFQVYTVPMPAVISTMREVKVKKPKAKATKGKKKAVPEQVTPTLEEVKEVVFITHRDDEKVKYWYITNDGQRTEGEKAMADITTITKVDPDDLVRMFNPAA